MAVIPQRELRNNVSEVLRRAEQGERFTITVNGRPVADLGPHEAEPRRQKPLGEVLRATPVDRRWFEELMAMRDEEYGLEDWAPKP